MHAIQKTIELAFYGTMICWIVGSIPNLIMFFAGYKLSPPLTKREARRSTQLTSLYILISFIAFVGISIYEISTGRTHSGLFVSGLPLSFNLFFLHALFMWCITSINFGRILRSKTELKKISEQATKEQIAEKEYIPETHDNFR